MYKKLFMQNIDYAIKSGEDLVVWITNPDMPAPEKITNPVKNLEYKKTYYDNAYTDKMHLKSNPAIKVVAFTTEDPE